MSNQFEEFMSLLKYKQGPDILNLIGEEYNLAQRYHENQFRDDGITPNFNHCVDVATILIKEFNI